MTETPDIFAELVASQGWGLFLSAVVKPKVEEIRKACLTDARLSEKDHYAKVTLLHTLRELVASAYINAGYDADALPTSVGRLFS